MSEFDQHRDYQALHKKYQSEATELPPAQLDQHILEAAQQSIKLAEQPGVDTVPVKRAWYVPVSYVAILVISLSIMMKLAFEPGLLDQIELDSIDSDSMGVGMPEETGIHKPSMTIYSDDASRARQQLPTISEKRPQSAKNTERKLDKAATVDNIPTSEKEKKSTTQIQQHAMPAASSIAEPGVDGRALPQAANPEAEETLSDSGPDSGPELRQAYVDRMLHLLESQQFERLKVMLNEYRKIYGDQDLPEALRDWQAKKTSESLQND